MGNSVIHVGTGGGGERVLFVVWCVCEHRVLRGCVWGGVCLADGRGVW